MASHTLTPAVWGICRCKAKAELRRSPRDFQIRKRLSSLLKLNLDSSLKKTWFHSVAVQSRRARHYSKRRILWVGVIGSILKGPCDTRCPSARRLAKTPGPVVKVLPVSGQRPMMQLSLCVSVV
ncbi:uncharacterized protein TNCV_4019951 [Trichonephila clavipes]|nr:uncharacterized protein TNCV_4019951 [Trichonephila clavipes]